MSSPITIVAGEPATIPLQCRLRGSGTVAAMFNFDDVLTGVVRSSRNIVDASDMTVEFYTAGGNQTGYTQGQIEASMTADQTAALTPTLPYTLIVHRSLSVDLAHPELIVRLPLTVEALAIQ